MIIKIVAALKLSNKTWWSATYSASKEFRFRWPDVVHIKAVTNHIKRNHDNN